MLNSLVKSCQKATFCVEFAVFCTIQTSSGLVIFWTQSNPRKKRKESIIMNRSEKFSENFDFVQNRPVLHALETASRTYCRISQGAPVIHQPREADHSDSSRLCGPSALLWRAPKEHSLQNRLCPPPKLASSRAPDTEQPFSLALNDEAFARISNIFIKKRTT